MDESTTDKIKGAFHEAKGTVKEKVGEVINDHELADEGHAEKIDGKVQQKIGDIKKVFEK